MRLIDAEAAIDALNQLRETTYATDYGIVDCDDAISAIATLPTIQSQTGKWIPVSERLPEGAFGCLVTVMDANPVTMDEFENILPYFVGWDGEQWNDADGEQCPFEVLAWMPLPRAYEVTE